MTRAALPAKRRVMTIMLCVFALLGAICVGFAVKHALQARAALNWPTTPGTITTSEIVEHKKRDSKSNRWISSYHAKVVYEYSVNGVSHTSDRVSFAEYSSSSPNHSDEVVRTYPAGSAVTVRYDPQDPAVSTLEAGLTAGGYAMFACSTVFLIVPLFMLLVIRTARPWTDADTRELQAAGEDQT